MFYVLLVLLIFLLPVWWLTIWTRRGVIQYNFFVIFKKDLKDFLFQLPFFQRSVDICRDFPNHRYVGIYQNFIPMLCIKEQKLIRQILISDFEYFMERHTPLPADGDPILERTLFILQGKEWKLMRKIAIPQFSLRKIKIMYEIMTECCQKFIESLHNQVKENSTLDIKYLFDHLTTDIFLTTHFGIYVNSLENPNNEFHVMIKKVFDFNFWFKLRVVLIYLFPLITQFLGIRIFNQKMVNYFKRLVEDNIKCRTQNQKTRQDLIDFLYSQSSPNYTLTLSDTTAFVISFFAAGYDTVSTLLCFICYELATNQKEQQILQDEIDKNIHDCNGTVSYQQMLKMKYLNCVVSETLRLWSSSAFLERKCLKPYTIPPTAPGETPVYLKKGDYISVPIFGLHRDPNIYQDPDRFEPERFLDNDKLYLPFGTGPRQCIAKSFALTAAKVALFHLLLNFNFVAVEKTAKNIRLQRNKLQIMSKDGYWLGLQKRNKM